MVNCVRWIRWVSGSNAAANGAYRVSLRCDFRRHHHGDRRRQYAGPEYSPGYRPERQRPRARVVRLVHRYDWTALRLWYHGCTPEWAARGGHLGGRHRRCYSGPCVWYLHLFAGALGTAQQESATRLSGNYRIRHWRHDRRRHAVVDCGRHWRWIRRAGCAHRSLAVSHRESAGISGVSSIPLVSAVRSALLAPRGESYHAAISRYATIAIPTPVILPAIRRLSSHWSISAKRHARITVWTGAGVSASSARLPASGA